MRVRITRIPASGELEEYDLRHLVVGQEIETSTRLGTMLLMLDCAELPAIGHGEAADRGLPPRTHLVLVAESLPPKHALVRLAEGCGAHLRRRAERRGRGIESLDIGEVVSAVLRPQGSRSVARGVAWTSIVRRGAAALTRLGGAYGRAVVRDAGGTAPADAPEGAAGNPYQDLFLLRRAA